MRVRMRVEYINTRIPAPARLHILIYGKISKSELTIDEIAATLAAILETRDKFSRGFENPRHLEARVFDIHGNISRDFRNPRQIQPRV